MGLNLNFNPDIAATAVVKPGSATWRSTEWLQKANDLNSNPGYASAQLDDLEQVT